MYIIKRLLYLLSIASFLSYSGCRDANSSEPELSVTGKADLSTYVAIGNSITAGFQSNSLYKSAQIYSYSNIIARQSGVSFTQPIISDPGIHNFRMEFGGYTSNGKPIIIKNYKLGSAENPDYNKPYNNLGVPGAYLFDILNATNSFNCYSAKQGGSINPMFDLVLRNAKIGIGSQFSQAKNLKATFITLWIGNNDILGYATNGATGRNPTNTDQFASWYNELLDSLKTITNDVVVANIPEIKDIAYFNVIPIPINNPDTELESVVYGITKDGIRKLTSGDRIVLSALDIIYNVNGNLTGRGLTQDDPLEDKYVLDITEAEEISLIISKYNSSIKKSADKHNFALVDINSFFRTIKNNETSGGTIVDGIKFTTEYIKGSLFSLDGVHPGSRGQGLIANEFIKVINAKYEGSIPLINISDIPAAPGSERFQISKILLNDYQ